MQTRNFVQGLSWLLLFNVAIKPAWIFLIDRQVQNTVGNEVYGSYFALLNLTYVLLFIADAGLTNMMVQQIAGSAARCTKQFLQIKLVFLFVYVVASYLFAWFCGITNWNIFIYLVLIQLAGSLLLFLRGLLAANQLYKADAWFSIADKSLMILFCSFFIYAWLAPITIEIFLRLQLVATSITLLLLSIVISKRKLLTTGFKENPSTVLKSILPFAAIILLMSMHYRLDGFLLERIRTGGAMQAGTYAAAYRLLDAGNMIGYLTASFLVAFVAKHKGDKILVRKVITSLQHGLLFIAITGACFVIVFAPWLQATLYHTTDLFHSQVMRLCLAVLPAYFITHIYGSVLTATHQLRTFTAILCIAVIINIGLNLLLIPTKGAIGSCVAALVSQYSCAFACAYVIKKKFGPANQLQSVLIYVGGGGCFLVLLFLLQSIIHSVWIILAVLAILLLAVVFIKQKLVKKFVQSLIQ